MININIDKEVLTIKNLKKFKIIRLPVVLISIFALLTATCFAYTVTDTGIYNKWQALGGSGGFLGSPVENTIRSASNNGYVNKFQGGNIYRKDGNANAYEVHGFILNKYNALNVENGVLGYPVTDECDAYNGLGRCNHFENGSIYYKWGDTAAYSVRGSIRSFYSWTGWEAGPFGFPKSDEYGVNGKRDSRFENGAIYYRSTSGDTWPVLSVAKIDPRLKIDIIRNQLGAYYTISGSGFTPNTNVVLYVSRVDCTSYVNSFKTDSNGNIRQYNSYDHGSYIEHTNVNSVNGFVTFYVKCASGSIAVCTKAAGWLGSPANLD